MTLHFPTPPGCSDEEWEKMCANESRDFQHTLYCNYVKKSKGIKDTNPKDAVGVGKAPMSMIPTPALHAIGLAMMEGARKYGRHNYRTAGIRYSVYYDAVMRHMDQWWEGEDIDADSNLPHPIKAAACLVILYDAMIRENGTDDRPPKSPAGWMEEMNKHAQWLLEKYPDPVDPHTQRRTNDLRKGAEEE